MFDVKCKMIVRPITSLNYLTFTAEKAFTRATKRGESTATTDDRNEFGVTREIQREERGEGEG